MPSARIAIRSLPPSFGKLISSTAELISSVVPSEHEDRTKQTRPSDIADNKIVFLMILWFFAKISHEL